MRIVIAALFFSQVAFAADYGLDDPCNSKPCIKAAPPGPTCFWIATNRILPYIGCGFSDIGVANPGKFECGQVGNGASCEEHCIFIQCEDG